jgi:hypothetical protein
MEKEQREAARDIALEDAIKNFTDNLNPEVPEEEQPQFNKEEFLQKWDEDHPDIEIPEDIEYDIDADFEIEIPQA